MEGDMYLSGLSYIREQDNIALYVVVTRQVKLFRGVVPHGHNRNRKLGNRFALYIAIYPCACISATPLPSVFKPVCIKPQFLNRYVTKILLCID